MVRSPKKTKMKDKKKSIKHSNITQLILGVIFILLINIISAFLYTRFDLTSEKRYSLSKATVNLIRNLKDEVFFKVYLEGDLPSGFRQLANETKEMLDEFHAYSRNIQFEFVDPSDNPNPKERNDTYRLLMERGLQPTDLRVNEKGQSKRLIIFPGAIVSYGGREVPVQLLMTQLGQNPDKVLNNSVQELEYNLASAIQKLIQPVKPRIAIIEGQGELSPAETFDIQESLSGFYNVDRVTLNQKISSLAIRLKTDSVSDKLVNKYRMIIIAKPMKPFEEKDKFLIDQYIMRGGKVLWLLDPVFASLDSLKYGATMGIRNDVNLEDLLFNYGVRVNSDLVMDLNALPIPLKSGQIGNQPQLEFFPWYYFPVLTPLQNHPMVKGLNAIKTEFISTIDTVHVPGVKKTILLTSSQYSRKVNAPVYIDVDLVKEQPDERLYNSGPQPVAVLLEGNFISGFQFRIPPELVNNKDLGFLPQSTKPGKMIIVGDGDIIKNQFHYSKGYALPLGFDQYTQQTFGNKDFILNAVNYLCDDSGLISVRSRELELRLLDATKIAKQRIFWQLINLLTPIAIILLFGVLKTRLRKNHFSQKARISG